MRPASLGQIGTRRFKCVRGATNELLAKLRSSEWLLTSACEQRESSRAERTWSQIMHWMMQASHLVFWMCSRSCSIQRVEKTDCAKQQNTCTPHVFQGSTSVWT
jgi:hypothetical protein